MTDEIIAKHPREWKRERTALRREMDRKEAWGDEATLIAGEALHLLALACDVLGGLSGRTREEVLDALRDARRLASL